LAISEKKTIKPKFVSFDRQPSSEDKTSRPENIFRTNFVSFDIRPSGQNFTSVRMEYSTYEPAAGYPIGVIVSGESNLAYDSSGHLLAPALETIGVWNLRHGLCTKSLAPMLGYSKKVTSIASSPSSQPQVRASFSFLFGL
jgi:hypothetical protein